MSDPILDIIDDSNTTTIGETTSVVLNILAIAEQGPQGAAGSVNQSAVDAFLSTAVSAAVSALHASVAAESAARVAGDDALSLRINSAVSGIGGAGSVTSQEFSVLSARVNANSAQMTSADASEVSNRVSADNALSIRVNTVSNAASNAASVAQAAMDAVTDEVSNRIGGDDALSNAISAKTISSLIGVSIAGAADGQVLIYNSADGKWHASTVAGGSGSVTSQELSVAIALEVSNRTSADNVLSANLASVQSILSTTRSAMLANSAQMVSADNAISAAQAATSAAVTSVNNRISGVSATVSSNSAQMTSADNANSQAISALSQNLSANSVVLSNTRSAVVANSAQMTSADNALSVQIASVASAHSALSAYVNKAIGSEFAGGNISAGSVVIDWANGRNQAFSIQGSVAIATPLNGSAGASYILRFQQDGTGSRQATWASAFAFEASTPPTFGGASAVDIVGFYFDGTTYYGTGGATGGSGSVTSTELSNAVSALSNAISVEAAARISADNAISANLGSVQSIVSTTRSSLSALSADVTSIKDRVSANSALLSTAVSALSQAISAKTISSLIGVSIAGAADQQVLTYNSADGKWHASTIAAGTGSATSNKVSIAIAVETSNRVSADNAVSANALSMNNVLSQQISALSAYVNKAIGSEFAGGNISAGSVVIDWSQGGAQAFSIQGSVAFAAPTNISAGRSYMLRIVQDATGSRQPTWASQFQWVGGSAPSLGSVSAVDLIAFYADSNSTLIGMHPTVGIGSVTSNELSGELSNRVSADNALSVRIDTQSQGLSALSQQVSVMSVQVASIQSAVSAISAAVVSVNNRISGISAAHSVLSADLTSVKNVVSIHSQAISVHSQAISVLVAGLGGVQMKAITNVQGLSGTALTNVSGLSASVAAGGLYQIEGKIIFTMSVADTFGFGLTFPAMVPLKAAGKWQTNVSVGNTGASGFLSNIADQGYFGDTGSGSIGVSAIAGTAGVPYIAEITGLFAVSAAGTIQVQARVSATTQPMNIQTGYLRAYKIS